MNILVAFGIGGSVLGFVALVCKAVITEALPLFAAFGPI